MGDDEVAVAVSQTDWSTPRRGIGEKSASAVPAHPPRVLTNIEPANNARWPAFVPPIAAAVVAVTIAALAFLSSAKTAGPVGLFSHPAGADIFIDGNRISGKTPLEIAEPLAIGPHVVRFELSGYESADGSMIVHAGGKNTFELELKPASATPVSPTTQDKHGQVSVRAPLVLKVWNGTTLLGATPLKKELTAGTYTLRLEHEPSGWSETRKVTVHEGAAERLDVAMALGKLRVNILPFGNVRVGNITGETPLAPIDLPAGKYSVRLWNSELKKEERTQVVIAPGKETTLERNWGNR
jgi:hypothetical protein